MKNACFAGIALLSVFVTSSTEAQIVIAHRGASGYVPEHTFAAKAMAHQMGVDFIEQDVVLTKDSETIVLHDIYLDTVTDVDDLYPERKRADGRYYAIDFTMSEISELRVRERINKRTAGGLFPRAEFPKRFPNGAPPMFTVPKLAEELHLIQGLNKSTGRNVGVYVEIKAPKWHRDQGKDITLIVLEQLERFGYTDKEDNVFVQCFDAKETRRMREELKTKLPLVQLLDGEDWRESTRSSQARLKEIAEYADGIGPPISLILNGRKDGKLQVTNLATEAQATGLKVHPYTLRTDRLPDSVKSYQELTEALFSRAKVDGVFSDQPDKTLAELDRLKRIPN